MNEENGYLWGVVVDGLIRMEKFKLNCMNIYIDNKMKEFHSKFGDSAPVVAFNNWESCNAVDGWIRATLADAILTARWEERKRKT